MQCSNILDLNDDCLCLIFDCLPDIFSRVNFANATPRFMAIFERCMFIFEDHIIDLAIENKDLDLNFWKLAGQYMHALRGVDTTNLDFYAKHCENLEILYYHMNEEAEDLSNMFERFKHLKSLVLSSLCSSRAEMTIVPTLEYLSLFNLPFPGPINFSSNKLKLLQLAYCKIENFDLFKTKLPDMECLYITLARTHANVIKMNNILQLISINWPNLKQLKLKTTKNTNYMLLTQLENLERLSLDCGGSRSLLKTPFWQRLKNRNIMEGIELIGSFKLLVEHFRLMGKMTTLTDVKFLHNRYIKEHHVVHLSSLPNLYKLFIYDCNYIPEMTDNLRRKFLNLRKLRISDLAPENFSDTEVRSNSDPSEYSDTSSHNNDDDAQM